MTIAAALLLVVAQAAAPAAPARVQPAADALKPIDSALAIETFKQVCWGAFRDPIAFHAAVVNAPLPLAQQPRREASGPGELYKSDEAALTYTASDSLPPNIPSRQCILRVRLVGVPDQLSLAARIATALGLPNGSTRTNAQISSTIWTIAGDDGRSTRLIAATRSVAGGQAELRLTALLLAQR